MEQILAGLIGKKIDVSCGTTAVLRGTVREIRDGVLYMDDEDGNAAYVAIDKIALICECSAGQSRPGFVA